LAGAAFFAGWLAGAAVSGVAAAVAFFAGMNVNVAASRRGTPSGRRPDMG
jgi:hypothetical protein